MIDNGSASTARRHGARAPSVRQAGGAARQRGLRPGRRARNWHGHGRVDRARQQRRDGRARRARRAWSRRGARTIASASSPRRSGSSRTRRRSTPPGSRSTGSGSARTASRAPADEVRRRQAGEIFGASGCVTRLPAADARRDRRLRRSFFAYLEDADVAWRARMAGWTLPVRAAAIADHHGSATAGEGSAAEVRARRAQPRTADRQERHDRPAPARGCRRSCSTTSPT